MRTREILLALPLCGIILLSVGLWILRYPALYHYYLWRLNHSAEESVVMRLNEEIESISSHIVPLLARTYEDAEASRKNREAAAIGLMRTDKDRAETLFLEHKDEAIYATLYYYYLWRLDDTGVGSLIIDLHEDIETISPHIVPLLIRTYEDAKASSKSRNAAGHGLIRANKEKAEALFIGFLDSKDDELVRVAIWNLAAARTERVFNDISKLSSHPNDEIRSAARYYLEHFDSSGKIIEQNRNYPE